MELARRYNSFAGKVARLGMLKQQYASIEQYVTGKTLDGLYLVTGE